MPDQMKEVEDMEKFMTILMEVKVSLAEQNGKLDNLLDMKERMNETYDIAKSADSRSLENEKDIESLKKDITFTASKDDVERIVKQRENTFKNMPAWIALFISLAGFVLTYLIN